MAIFTRTAGDAQGINNVDAKYDGTLGTIIATGLTKNPTAFKVAGLTGTLSAAESATGGPVEAILRAIAVDSTVVMYQVDTDRISVLVEATGTNAAGLQTRIRALGGNIGLAANIFATNATVSSADGFKLA
jgi:hypothetical protein